MKKLTEYLTEPAIKNMDMDSVQRLEVHSKIQNNKIMLKQVFKEFHKLFRLLDKKFLNGDGIELEIGAGIAPMRSTYPNVLATDLVFSPHLDFVLDAQKMTELADSTVRVIFGQNCFHHLPHPELFFKELERVLSPGGGAILLEPYYSLMATFLFKHMFSSEGFDKDYVSWESPQSGPMNGANQALSYIVFVRDRKKFLSKYPGLKIIHLQPVGNYLRYLLSGGLNFRQLVPDCCIPIIRLLESALYPFNRFLALHHIIVIKRA